MNGFNPVNILYQEPDLSGAQILDPNPVLWPVLAYHVVLTAKKNKAFNIFENTVLRLCQAVSCDYQRLCDITCMEKGFIKLIVAKLRDNGLLAGFEPTAAGIKKIDGGEQIETPHFSAYVFRDCCSGQWLPAILMELNTLRGRNEENETFSFRIANGVKRISARKINVSSGKLGRLQQEAVQRRDVINILRRLGKIRFYCGKDASSYPLLEEESIAIPDPHDGKLVYLYTLAGCSPYNHQIIVWDPFHPCSSSILSDDFLMPSFSDIANDFFASISVNSVEDSDCKWDSIRMGNPSISEYLRPLDPAIERLNDKKCIDLLSGYYTAIEISMRELIKKYDYSSAISYLKMLTHNQMNPFMQGHAEKSGFKVPWKVRYADDFIAPYIGCTTSDELANLPMRKKSQRESSETTVQDKQQNNTASPVLRCEFNEKFFSFGGGRYQNNWLAEGNIPSLFGLLLVLYDEKPVVQMQSLLDHGKGDCLCFFSYLTQYKNAASHGEVTSKLPVKEVVELCRTETIELISDLYPEALQGKHTPKINVEEKDTKQSNWNNSEYYLEKRFGYGRYQLLPQNIRESLREMLIAQKEGNYIGFFGYAQGIIDNLSFRALSDIQAKFHCHLSGIGVCEKVKRIWHDLPDTFFEISTQKIQNTLNGHKLSLRANILCLMAVLPCPEKFFTPERIIFLEQVMSMRTHNWQESVIATGPEKVFSLQDPVIDFVNNLLKECEI